MKRNQVSRRNLVSGCVVSGCVPLSHRFLAFLQRIGWAVLSMCLVVACTVVTPQPTQVLAPSVTTSPIHTPNSTPSPQPIEFSGQRAYQSVVQQVGLGPRITGSAANQQLGDQVLAELSANGWLTQTQSFSYQQTTVRNLAGMKGEGKDVVILGAHYDSRRRADKDTGHPDQPVPGADDGASGVAVLLELSRVLQFEKLDKQVWLVFFDAEDNGDLDGWDWIVGSTYYANSLTITPTAVVVIDMIGDQQQTLYQERNSNEVVSNEIWDTAARLGYGAQFVKQYKWRMVDDHSPFLARGWPAVDIIDFDYPYWHTTQDTPDKISADSLERVGRTLKAWLESE